ncbi:hypothetical protein AB0A71_31960 [Kitasatospora aureofaciens]|uniref:hypothetical protein n=1 Tax=Kitasatospora aureofaciens TaxID=1894 RepID=UPI003405B472
MAAGVLLSLRWSIGGVAAPAAAGLLIATAGAPAKGTRYVARRPDLLGTCPADLAATVFALPTALFPFPAE